MPVSVVLEGVDFSVERSEGETAVTYRTPHGSVRTRVRFDEGMRRAGVTLGHVSERAIKSGGDCRAVAWMFERASVIGNPAGFAELERLVGDRGVAVGYASPAASPMHHLLHLLMPFDLLYYELADNPAGLAACADAVGGFMERLLDMAASSAASIVFWGGNFDTTLTPPPFFRTHILPWLAKAADRLHANGRKLLSHPDGENTGLLEMYREAGMDVADSICPAPMTRLGLAEVRKVFGREVAILGGIPSIALLPESMPEAEFGRFLDRFFVELGDGAGLVLGVSDTTPPGAEFERLVKIGERARAFGPVPGS